MLEFTPLLDQLVELFGHNSIFHGMFRDLPGRYSSPESRFRFSEAVQARKWPKAPEMGLKEPKSGFLP
jgi:hypothetical protein